MSISNNNKSLYTNEFLKILINKLKSKLNEKTIENKISKIESDYYDKLNKLELFCSNEEEIQNIIKKK